ncbi:MAG TPA: PLP-dependent transferase, partial [Gemmatimonadales bacterium]|nr:PLP-dependent transferase [Gemmatimonadales bacterium]
MSRQFGISTTAIHGIPHRRADWTPVAPAVQQSSTFTNPVGKDDDILYSRYGNNPNQLALAAKYALLEGAEDAIFVASGMGATALAHLAVLRPGDHLIASSWIYGGTQHLFDQELARFGIEVTYVSPDHPRQWRKAVRKSTRAIFVETPTNPLMRIIDLSPIAYVAEEEGLALLV